VLLPVRSVGVMGDERTYEEVVRRARGALGRRDDGRLGEDPVRGARARISSRIINEVRGINRVVYDISSSRRRPSNGSEVALPIGVHRISVTAPGYFPWDKAVEAKPGGTLIRLDVALAPVPD
jgi:hypothetical protein